MDADVAWACQPDAIPMSQNMLEHPPQLANAVGPSQYTPPR
jgi:hypothetical protein